MRIQVSQCGKRTSLAWDGRGLSASLKSGTCGAFVSCNALRTTRSILSKWNGFSEHDAKGNRRRHKVKMMAALETRTFEIKQIFPDSKCRLDREFVSACDARPARRNWSPRATSVFSPTRFHARL